jgi:hypothetical protein
MRSTDGCSCLGIVEGQVCWIFVAGLWPWLLLCWQPFGRSGSKFAACVSCADPPQLVCLVVLLAGVLEAVRISCAGFPNKRPFPDFVDHFWSLAPELYHMPDLDDR